MGEINQVRINKLLQIRGKTSQKDFATSIDMNPSYYCRLESGATPISDKTMKRIAKQYNVMYKVLIDDTIQEITPMDFEMVDDISPITRRLHERKTFSNKAHQLLDDIISYGGSDNLQYMKDLNSFLLEVQYLLEYKNQFDDLSENEDKVIDKGQRLIEILLEMA